MNRKKAAIEIGLREFQFTYDVVQDRLHLVILTRNQQQGILWFTRRLIYKMWPGLTDLLSQYPVDGVEGSTRSVSEQQIAPNHIERRFEYQDFQSPKVQILGDWQELLIAKVGVNQLIEDNLLALDLMNERNQGVRLIVTPALLRTLCQMIAQALQSAEWHLSSVEKMQLRQAADFNEACSDAEPVVVKSSARAN